MAGPRPPRDIGSAPGELPGAESFARRREATPPQGIVRLSDLAGFKGSAATGEGKSPAKVGASDAAGQGGGIGPSSGAERVPEHARDPRKTRRAQSPIGSGGAYDADPAPETGTGSPVARDVEPDAGPAYESLFGDDGDTRRRPRRERKPATALQRALGLLTRREHSRKELVLKLVSRGVDATEVEAAVDKLTGAGWQDDRRFAGSLVRSRAANGYGPLHIRAELGTHDLPAEVRQAALDDFDGDWAQIARDAVERRFGRIDDVRERERKAADYLMRRGFPADIARAAARFPSGD